MKQERKVSKLLGILPVLLAAGLWTADAGAWGRANAFGGASEHSFGQSEHENRWGGSTDHVAGEGTEHTNMYGGTTAGRYGEGAYHTYPGGGTAYHPPGAPPPPPGGYPGYPAYHPPVVVPAYSTGCYGCAAAAGAVVGVATGAAIASASNAAATSNAYAAGVATGAATANANAYNAGVAAGAAAAAPAPMYSMGTSYASLPAGCIRPSVAGGTYYLCGNTWFKPVFGANGVLYQVVPTP